MRLGHKMITVRVIPVDIARGECANRRQCVIAQAVDRQFELGGRGYIRVDANEVSMTHGAKRYRYHPPRPLLTYLRRFDRIGEQQGLTAAREAMEPAAFVCKLLSANAIPPVASRKRKDQINDARRKRHAELKARGIYREPHRRYVGV